MNELAVFDAVTATLAKAKAENATLVFDYADPDGEKDARSHISKLRKVKTKISDVHKEAKAEALALGKALDGKKRELIGEVEGMIAVHKEPLDAIEAEKQVAIDAEKKKFEEAEAKRQADLEAREAAVKEEELKLAAERVEAGRVAREQIIAKEAADQARIRAEQKAKAEANAKELAEKKAKDEAEAKEKRRVENKKHRKKIEDEAHAGLTKTGHLGNVEASEVLTAIMENRIPHITIVY